MLKRGTSHLSVNSMTKAISMVPGFSSKATVKVLSEKWTILETLLPTTLGI